jgi:hypothetical protein
MPAKVPIKINKKEVKKANKNGEITFNTKGGDSINK